MNKKIFKKILFMLMIFSISFYSFHSLAFNLVYDKEHNKAVIEQSLKSSHFEADTSNDYAHLVEHELHKSFLNNAKDNFYTVIFFNKEFFNSFENYLFKISTNLLKPPNF